MQGNSMVDEVTIATIVDDRLGKLEVKLMARMDQIIQGIELQAPALGKMEASMKDKTSALLTNGMESLTKQMERGQALLESKVEFVFSAQNRQHEDTQGQMQKNLETMAENVFSKASGQVDSNQVFFQNITKALDYQSEKLEELHD